MSAPPHKLLIATTNGGKLREVTEVLNGFKLAIVGLADYPELPEAIEDGATFENNAQIKALHYARLTGCRTLADDSGLCVDALNGEPGVHSARFAGTPPNDAANNRKLIAALQGKSEAQRLARFVCVLVLAEPSTAGGMPTIVRTARGEVEGVIIDQPRGSNGFGYDPHFFIPDLGKTAAELPPEEKNAISHRGKALRALAATAVG